MTTKIKQNQQSNATGHDAIGLLLRIHSPKLGQNEHDVGSLQIQSRLQR